jgi:hypothetical protein
MSVSARAAALLLLLAAAAAGAEQAGRGIAVVKGTASIEQTAGNAGRRYALCIGINGYEDPDINRLEKARNDAAGLGEALKSYGQFDSVFVMTDEVDPRHDPQMSYPRLSNIRGRLTYLQGFITPADLVVVSFSGHGIANEAGDSYLITADTSARDPFTTALPLKEVVDWLGGLKVRKSLLLIDACRETVPARASRGLSSTRLQTEKFERAEVAAVLYATRSGWYSYEDRETPYGVFTRFLLDGVKGKADYQYGNRDGIVTFRELSGFVEDAVAAYALGQGLKQRPYTKITGETFGDLAVSTYSASIDTGTRADVGGTPPAAPAGPGLALVYSNVEGKLSLDGTPHGEIGRGAILRLEDLPGGAHFLEITHGYGVFRAEVSISRARPVPVVNLVIAADRDPRVLSGVTFVHVGGSGGVPGFWISDSEITLGQFAEFVQQTGYAAQGNWQQYYKPAWAMYPVIGVTWDDAAAYVRWLARKSGAAVSLPTLAQWHFAAGGRAGSAYPWGNDWEPQYCQSAESDAPGALPLINEKGPVQVQRFAMDITLDGVTHMAGNVREWCADQKKAADGSTVLSGAAGGSWRLSKPKFFAAASEAWAPANSVEEDLGFRVAVTGD